jgi:hypothetical protein
VKEKLAQSLFDHIPVGVGSQGIIPTTTDGLEAALEMGMDWYGLCHALRILARAPGVIDFPSLRIFNLGGRCAHNLEAAPAVHSSGRCERGTRGLRTRSTVRSTGACSVPTPTKCAAIASDPPSRVLDGEALRRHIY